MKDRLGLPPALWRLNGLLALGAFRTLWRRTLTMSGVYLIALMIGVVLVVLMDRARIVPTLTRMFFLFSPVVLTLLAVFSVRSGLNGTAFFFTAAETSFLLTAPLPHRALVNYKFHQLTILVGFVALLAAAFLTEGLASFALFSGKLLCVLLFLQLMPLVIASFVKNEDAPVVKGLRAALDILQGVLIGSMLLAMYLRALGKVELSMGPITVFSSLTSPISIIDLRLWHREARVGWETVGGIAVVDAMLAAIFFARRSHLTIESLFYKNLRRERAWERLLGGAFARPRAKESAGRGLIAFGAGIGPLLWRKVQECRRHAPAGVFLATLTCIGFTALTLFFRRVNNLGDLPVFMPWHLFYCAALFMTLALLFARFVDFRADGDKMERLLTLPVSASKLLAAELLPAQVSFTAYLIFLSCAGTLLYGRDEARHALPWAVGAAPFVAGTYLFAANAIALMFPVSRIATGKMALSLLTQFGAELFGLGLLARLHYSLVKWHDFPTVLAASVAAAVLGLVACLFAIRRFNPTRLTT